MFSCGFAACSEWFHLFLNEQKSDNVSDLMRFYQGTSLRDPLVPKIAEIASCETEKLGMDHRVERGKQPKNS